MSDDRPRVLVTGAAGRLGRTVAGRFHAEGFDLLATDVVDPGDVPYPFERADLRDHRAASRLVADIDVLLHIGNHPGIGPWPPQQVFNENIAMNENMFQGAAEHGVGTIVFASTLQLIGSHPDDRTVVHPPPRPKFPISGETTPAPANVYALSKTVSETMLRYYAERCGIACTALRFPLLHHGDERVMVGSGEERPVDVFEGFTGLTYDDAAGLFLAVVRAELIGFHVFMAGTAHRHRDLTVSELVRRHYPEVDPDTSDLIDMSALISATGWRPESNAPASGPAPRAHRPGD
jgi:nucleoside-diphosphate-sugar epimerase